MSNATQHPGTSLQAITADSVPSVAVHGSSSTGCNNFLDILTKTFVALSCTVSVPDGTKDDHI